LVDKALLLRKLTELEEYFRQLKEFSNITLKDYEKDWKTQRIVERTLQIMIEICADIANHIISDRAYRVPKSYVDTFEILYEEGILEASLFETMKKIARFRNILVHHYEKINGSIMIGILKKDIDDFLKYRNAIITILGKID